MRSAPPPASPSDDGLIQIDPSPFPSPSPSPEENGPAPAGPGGGGTSRRTMRLRIGAGVAVVVVTVVAVVVLVSGGSGGHPHVLPPTVSPSARPSPAPTVPAFTFPMKVVAVPVTGKGGQRASQDAAAAVQAALSRFYVQGFLAPDTWSKGAPDSAWDLFAASDRARAKGDAPSLALETQATGLTRLDVTKSGLTVRVLLDAQGHAVAAVAQVTFQATGTIGDGELVEVTNEASFLLRPVSGKWLIVGYPSANTEVSAPASPSPSPSATPSPTPGSATPGSATPSAGGSP